MNNQHLFLLLILLACLKPGQLALAQTTAFTYQGRLTENSSPANGIYDLKFEFEDDSGPVEGLGPIMLPTVAVNNGLFTVSLDFGAGAFAGGNRWREIGVRTNGNPNPYTTLTPRQPVTPTPFAIRASAAAGILGLPGEPVELTVNGQTALRLQSGSGSPNLIGGAQANVGEFGVSGATMAGGGAAIFNEQFVPWSNVVTEIFGTIGGGRENFNDGFSSTIGGGQNNDIIGCFSGLVGGGYVEPFGSVLTFDTAGRVLPLRGKPRAMCIENGATIYHECKKSGLTPW